MSIRTLHRVVPAAADKPVRPGAVDQQRMAQMIARDATAWTPEMAGTVVCEYNELAKVWNAERGGYRRDPLADALARGGEWPAGCCLEIGSGTGLLTPLLLGVWPQVVCMDLTEAMLTRATAGWRVCADASRLPIPDATMAAVVLGDAPLFAAEIVRVLTADGVLVVSNALGHDAPHHVPTRTVVEALTAAAGRQWSAVESDAGWGSWAVLRRD